MILSCWRVELLAKREKILVIFMPPLRADTGKT
jgi:hypothetical protein